MRGTTVLPAVLAVLALAACGPASSAAPGGGVPDPTGPASSEPGSVPPVAPEGSPPMITGPVPSLPEPSVVTPAPGARTRVVEWTRAGLSGDGRTVLLDVKVGGPPCDVVTAVTADETSDGVRVTVHAGALATANCTGAVPAMLGVFRVEAELSRPLGDRRVTGSA